VSFRETPEGVAPAVKSLFYGGEYRGYEFVYPAGGPNVISEIFAQPEITYTPMPPVPEPKLAEAAAPVVEPAIEPLPAPVEEAVSAPVELPRTASPMPFLAFGGLTSLLVGLGLALHRRRFN
jgi:LPXTG-motif cell wall-anchored protein